MDRHYRIVTYLFIIAACLALSVSLSACTIPEIDDGEMVCDIVLVFAYEDDELTGIDLVEFECEEE